MTPGRFFLPTDASMKLIEAQVERTPEAMAVWFEGESLTFRALNERANQLAHYLRARGAGPEGCVAVSMQRSVEMVVALLGVLKAGAAYVPLDPTFPAARLAFMLDGLQARAAAHPGCASGAVAGQCRPGDRAR